MSAFADSSALVKLYADEPGAQDTRGLGSIVVSQMCRVEVPAAIWRKVRMGELDASDARLLTEAFEADYSGDPEHGPRFAAVELAENLLAAAARLAAVHELRAYDAVQLASAAAARSADPDCDVFVCFDEDLRTAAAAEGFSLRPSV